MNIALAVSTAVLLALLFPPYDLPFLAPVALAPLLYACLRESSWRKFHVLMRVGPEAWRHKTSFIGTNFGGTPARRQTSRFRQYDAF